MVQFVVELKSMGRADALVSVVSTTLSRSCCFLCFPLQRHSTGSTAWGPSPAMTPPQRALPFPNLTCPTPLGPYELEEKPFLCGVCLCVVVGDVLTSPMSLTGWRSDSARDCLCLRMINGEKRPREEEMGL